MMRKPFDIIRPPGLIWPVKSIGGLGLGCCCNEMLPCCTGTVPGEYAVTFSGIIDYAASYCEDFNDTFILQYTELPTGFAGQSTCNWFYSNTAPTAFGIALATFQSIAWSYFVLELRVGGMFFRWQTEEHDGTYLYACSQNISLPFDRRFPNPIKYDSPCDYSGTPTAQITAL